MGATDSEGIESEFSQGGDLLTVAALGVAIDCPWRNGLDEINLSYPGNIQTKPAGTSQGTILSSLTVAKLIAISNGPNVRTNCLLLEFGSISEPD